jgi:hypothetical protein
MFLSVGTLVCAAQGNRNHAAYGVATPDQRDRKLVSPAVADKFDFIHEDSTLPEKPERSCSVVLAHLSPRRSIA